MQESKLSFANVSQQINSTDKEHTRVLSVGYFSPGWPREAYPNGIVSYVATMVEGLHAIGHRPYILCENLSPSKGDSTTQAEIVPFSTRSTSFTIRLFDAVSYRLRSDIAIANTLARGLSRAVNDLANTSNLNLLEMEESFGWAEFVRRKLSIPVLIRLHGPHFLNGAVSGAVEDRVFTHRVELERQAIANAFAISAPSLNVLEQTRHYYNLPLEKAVVVPCPVAQVSQEERWKAADCDPNLIAFVGRFDRHKGGDLMIDAFVKVVQRYPAARLQFAGPDSGYVDDIGKKWQFKEYVQSRLPGALESGQVEYLGHQPPARLNALRKRAQVTVIASRYDNFPYTALESLSLGCPIVASCAGGIPEIVTDEVSGLLFQASDAESLASQIIRMLENPGLAARLGERASVECGKRFTPEVVAKQSVALYEETLDRWSQRR